MSTQHQGEQLAALLKLGPLIPVITIHHLDDAVPLARALVAGGVRLLEITLRTEVGIAAAEAIGRCVPEAVVGVGTVLTPEDLTRAVGVGARFALSPGATRDLLDAARTAPIPFLPGIATASELMEAANRGFKTVKFFPASSMGGLNGLRALTAPFPTTRFCPTGGVGEDNVADWLAIKGVVAVGGSWLTPSEEVSRKDWTSITQRAEQISKRLKALHRPLD